MMQQWFEDAKLGIFVHWGIYAIQKRGGESWPIVNGQVSYDEYMTQMDEFTASQYDPENWADIFARSGAKYSVFNNQTPRWSRVVADKGRRPVGMQRRRSG